MVELPFLVVHGATVWKLLLAALVIVSVAAFGLSRLLLRRWWARLTARDLLRFRVRRVAAISEGDAYVRGRLRGGSLATLVGGKRTRDHVDGTPRIECADGTRVELAGRPRVVVGARTATSRVRVPKGTPEAIGDDFGRWVLCTVHDGDEIIASGKVARCARSGEAGYRDADSVWRLTDGEVFATTPAAKPRPAHPLALLIGLAAATAIATTGWYHVLRDAGASALARMYPAPERPTARAIDPYGDFAIAAALPGSRDEAFRRMSDRFDRYFQHVASVLPLHDTIDVAIDPCTGMDRKLRELRLDAALASERTCPDSDYHAHVQLLLGNYEQAVGSRAPRIREYAAIGAGDWEVAAAAAAVQANGIDPAYAEAVAHARCRAAWYQNLAGASISIPTTGHPRCRLYGALALPRGARREALDAIVRAERDKPSLDRDRLVELLELTLRDKPSSVPDIDLQGMEGAAWLLAHHVDDSKQRDLAGQLRASIAIIRGDFANARSELANVENVVSRSVLALRIALREGTELPHLDYPPVLGNYPAAIVRAGKPPPPEALMFLSADPRDCIDDLRGAIERAATGDGGPLAKVFAECRVNYPLLRGPELLFAVLPRVTEHRAELADALRVYREDIDAARVARWPFIFMRQAAEYRDLARLAGDDEEADRWQAIVGRHVAVLGDRDRATAFALLE